MVAALNQGKTQAKPGGGITLSHDAEAITILLVDDDPDCRMLIRDAIAECKVSNQVFEVCNGAEALDFLYARGKHAAATRPGLIFLDIEMPGMDGQETLKHIRADERFREIRVGCNVRHAETEFYVRDTGIGIEPEDIDKVFFVFRRGRSAAAQNVAGKGVGLASVKSIIETYEGTIWVESQLGKGTTFRFTINGKHVPDAGNPVQGRAA